MIPYVMRCRGAGHPIFTAALTALVAACGGTGTDGARRMADKTPPHADPPQETRAESSATTIRSASSGATEVIADPAPSSALKPWFVEDFESYGKGSGDPSEDFRENINGWWSDKFIGGWPNYAEIVEDPVMGQAYRQNQKVRTAADCKPGAGHGRELRFPGPEKEIWVEAYVRLSPTYRTDWEGKCGLSMGQPAARFALLESPEVESAAVVADDHKFIFWSRANSREGSTWRFKIGTFNSQVRLKAAKKDYGNQYARNNYPGLGHGPLPNRCMNGQWMRWRWHLRGASQQGVADGHYEWRWVEMDEPDVIYVNRCVGGGYQMKYLALTPTDQHDGFTGMELGKTFNNGPGAPQYWEYGEINVWRSDPGWRW